MENTTGNFSMRQKTKNALERIDALEKSFQNVVQAIDKNMNQLGSQVGSVSEVVNAIAIMLGVDAVRKTVEESRAAQDATEVARQNSEREKFIADGLLAYAETIQEKSVLVGKETTATGETVRPGQTQMQLEQIKPEFRNQLIGQKAGFVLDTPEGGKFEVLSVFEIVAEKAATVPPEAVAASSATTEAVAP